MTRPPHAPTAVLGVGLGLACAIPACVSVLPGRHGAVDCPGFDFYLHGRPADWSGPTTGGLIRFVVRESPAYTAGIRDADLVVSVEGEPIAHERDGLRKIRRHLRTQGCASLTVRRGAATMTFPCVASIPCASDPDAQSATDADLARYAPLADVEGEVERPGLYRIDGRSLAEAISAAGLRTGSELEVCVDAGYPRWGLQGCCGPLRTIDWNSFPNIGSYLVVLRRAGTPLPRPTGNVVRRVGRLVVISVPPGPAIVCHGALCVAVQHQGGREGELEPPADQCSPLRSPSE